MGSFIRITVKILLILIIIFNYTGDVSSETKNMNKDIRSFFSDISGSWIGTYVQFTDGKKTNYQYFCAIVKQKEPGTYITVFDYFIFDKKTNEFIKVGKTTMLTEINSDTSALNNIVGKGSIRVDGSAMKPEEHEISELLNLSESGDVTGEGDGIISVGNLSFGIGKNTYIEDYFTHWKLENGNWKINQVFSIKLQILMVTKSFYIDAWLKAQRGSNINDLKKNAIDEN